MVIDQTRNGITEIQLSAVPDIIAENRARAQIIFDSGTKVVFIFLNMMPAPSALFWRYMHRSNH
jgi:hypothetical protein